MTATASAPAGVPAIAANPEQVRILKTYEGGLIGMGTRLASPEAEELAAMSTPGTALVSTAIAQRPELAAGFTWAHRLVVVVSDGSAVLGLGDLGPRASLPVLEAKCAFLKRIAGIDAIPLVFAQRDTDSIVHALTALEPSFGAVSLEDVCAPRCFELEQRLQAALGCPVLHNDQHGTAVAVTAAVRNAATVLGRSFKAQRVVIVGAGAAGLATARLLYSSGVSDLVLVDRSGVIFRGRPGLAGAKRDISLLTNPRGVRGALADALDGADVLIGLSAGRIGDAPLARMNPAPVILALANPEPEVSAEQAKAVGALYGTGNAGAPNCVSNLMVVPGVFRGAFAAGSRVISRSMIAAAVEGLVRASEQGLSPLRLLPEVLDPAVCAYVSEAVEKAAPRS